MRTKIGILLIKFRKNLLIANLKLSDFFNLKSASLYATQPVQYVLGKNKEGKIVRNLIELAIGFAAFKHTGQVRKGTSIPYISHPFAVGMMLQQAGESEEVIAAGILHDTLEDTATTEEEIRTVFGEQVLLLVKAASEPDKSRPWEDRKRHTVSKLAARSREELAIIVADKLHNLRSIRLDLEETGEEVWNRFNRGKEQQEWYYRGIVNALISRHRELAMAEELKEEVARVFGNQ
ncbi:bifunctional (p)ppGpp synthetase/guanosine-3',5'-bis(diphosphate) 3'-pyrophosphohydrolase [Planococcus glaciei]|uniref:Bifunctional (P)ppGpp synthetase/guanosine-3',5'-bis(Diphosphate) 3'-pyrophosphohydrolase n=1 Tax=Planococcus glaciei TaxID=459472 RepID=A0A7H8Q7Y5_9BACL|nr:bifunctional (p)ppGpp synthetase/guanosine-3',5'-bis(diphosphate) 3'-pyrophosphohydrolase [Planococcus glaciei]